MNTDEGSQPSGAQWPTAKEAAARLDCSERAIRRAIAQPENAAQTRRETRRTSTGDRETTVIAPELLEKLAKERGANTGRTPAGKAAQHGANAAPMLETPADGQAPPLEHRQEAILYTAEGGATPAERGANAAQAEEHRQNAAPSDEEKARLYEEVRFLRARLESRDEAENDLRRQIADVTQALLREQQAHAEARRLHAGTMQTAQMLPAPIIDGQQDAPEAPTGTPRSQTATNTPTAPNGAQKATQRYRRPARAFWQVLLGIKPRE